MKCKECGFVIIAWSHEMEFCPECGKRVYTPEPIKLPNYGPAPMSYECYNRKCERFGESVSERENCSLCGKEVSVWVDGGLE